MFEVNKKHYLCVVDYYSRWIEIRYLPTTTAKCTIEKFKSIFACHGICDELHTDNATQFVGSEFADFAREYNFIHNTSSPHYHQGNGAAERAVKEAKKIVSQKDPALAMLNYRNTVHSTTKVSPAVALMGRQLKTKVPVLLSNLQPKTIDRKQLAKTDHLAKEKYKEYYDKKTRNLVPLDVGQKVLIKDTTEMKSSGWSNPGTVVEVNKHGRTYLVQTAKNILRRNRHHLQLIPEEQAATSPKEQIAQEATPEPTPPEPAPDQAPQPLLRRSSRQSKPPERLIQAM
jgi:hypothetical protein